MKKVKTMLMAIAGVAVTGGLVAAKVNRHTSFCTTVTTSSTTCPTFVEGTIVRGAINQGNTLVCTSPLETGNCPTSGYFTALTTTD